jgi:BRCA1-associated protein
MSSCWDCSSTTNLWICLICGNIGCGRYGRAHAQSHYQATSHLYALELETQRVWDYAGDGYVHRLIQNKADGKLVELPSASMSSFGSSTNSSRPLGPSTSDNLTAEKIEAIGIEYSYLLTSQLDSQREYFEKEMARLKEDFAKSQSMVMKEADTRVHELNDLVEKELKNRQRLEKKAEQSVAVARQLQKELREERAVNEGIMQNLAIVKDKLANAEKEKGEYNSKVTDLEEQVRDLMFFLEAKDKIDQGGEGFAEAAGGSVQIGPSSKSAGTNRRTKKG